LTNIITGIAIFTITILLCGGMTPFLLIQEADADIASGTLRSEVRSDKVCGAELCSTANTPEFDGITESDDIYDTDSNIPLLFVQSAISGTFEQKDGHNVLTFVEVSPTTVYFSDRPHRVTGFEKTELLTALWAEGDNSFASNPPNAALEIFNNNDHSQVFILELANPVYNYESETLQYHVKILAETGDAFSHYQDRHDGDLEIPATFEQSVLFIDDFISSMKHVGTAIAKTAEKYADDNVTVANEFNDGVADTDNDVIKTEQSVEGELAKGKKAVNYKNWEGTASNSVIGLAANATAAFGEDIGGAKGHQIGYAVGSALGQEAIKASAKALLREDIGATIDIGTLTDNIRTSLTFTADNYKIAYALSNNVIEENKQGIGFMLMKFITSLRDNPEFTAAYDADDFCGYSNYDYSLGVLYPIVLYNLEVSLKSRILYDLNNGMTNAQIIDDIGKNFDNDAYLVTMYALWQLQDECLSDDGNVRLYDLIFENFFSTDVTYAIPEFVHLIDLYVGNNPVLMSNIMGVVENPSAGNVGSSGNVAAETLPKSEFLKQLESAITTDEAIMDAIVSEINEEKYAETDGNILFSGELDLSESDSGFSDVDYEYDPYEFVRSGNYDASDGNGALYNSQFEAFPVLHDDDPAYDMAVDDLPFQDVMESQSIEVSIMEESAIDGISDGSRLQNLIESKLASVRINEELFEKFMKFTDDIGYLTEEELITQVDVLEADYSGYTQGIAEYVTTGIIEDIAVNAAEDAATDVVE